ncbi:MAG: glutamate-5-semialdehyde dehydrogenase [Spirochaetales bacterium]
MSTPVSTAIPAIARRLKALSPKLTAMTTEAKNRALQAMADALRRGALELAAANQKDLEAAELIGLATPLLSRLKFQGVKIAQAAEGVESVARLPDPVGRTLSARELDKGLELYQVTCPLGVIAMIFESRPDALVQMVALSLKSGNAVILKGGAEALHTNRALADLLLSASAAAGVPSGWFHLAETRDDVQALLELDDCLDLIIPRGSNEFVQHIMKNTTIPVLGHADGLCHLYVDGAAQVQKAISIIIDSKTQYVAVCNAVETVLVHRDIAPYLLPPLKQAFDEKEVEVRADPVARKLIPSAKEAFEQDWETEYLDYILSVKVVDSLDEAVAHINMYGSRHTDGIITENRATAETFLNSVDTANAFWNCSTRFADGFRYGLGAEVGVSTSKLHARGPVGLDGLVTYKWKLYGNGHIVDPYAGEGGKAFTHKDLLAGKAGK